MLSPSIATPKQEYLCLMEWDRWGGAIREGGSWRWGCNQGEGPPVIGSWGRCRGINFYQRGLFFNPAHRIKGVFRAGGGFRTQWEVGQVFFWGTKWL